MCIAWPDKEEREEFEISGFVRTYTRVSGTSPFEVLERREKPDFVVGRVGGEQIGVELTSVYLDDRSVPDKHKKDFDGLVPIDFDPAELEAYERRLVSAIEAKVEKARTGYDLSRSLVLSIYINEYIAIYLGQNDLEALVRRNERVFDSIHPFAEIFIWNLANDGVFSVRPE